VLCKDALAIGGGTAVAMATVASALMSDHQNYTVGCGKLLTLIIHHKILSRDQKNLVTMGNFSPHHF
jgi:hypothetical protein